MTRRPAAPGALSNRAGRFDSGRASGRAHPRSPGRLPRPAISGISRIVPLRPRRLARFVRLLILVLRLAPTAGAATVVLVVSGPAHARATACLRWDVSAESGRLEVGRADGDVPWQGAAPAEIASWDADGAERRQTLTSETGWTFERRPASGGWRVVCRQAELGFGVQLDLAASDDVLTVRVPGAAISETGAARLKWLRLLPRFGAACEGEPGYLVIAQQSGTICRYAAKKPAEHWLLVYQSICNCPMPLYQMVYHGVLLYNLSTEGVNSLPGEMGYLRNIEFGGAPLAYFYGHFLLDPTKNGLGQRELAQGVFETVYSNAERVVVNYRDQPYALPAAAPVPPRGFRLVRP